MSKKEMCPYCGKRPLVNRHDAKTCGNPECLFQHSSGGGKKNRKYKNKEGKLCPYCKKRLLLGRRDARTCGHPVCQEKNKRDREKITRGDAREREKVDGEFELPQEEGKFRFCRQCDKKFMSWGGLRICPVCTVNNRTISDDMLFIG